MSDAAQSVARDGQGADIRPMPEAVERSSASPRHSDVMHACGPRIRAEAFGNTDVGLQREGNEDSFAVLHELGLYMVADGMGGAAAGEVASKMAIACVREAFEDPDVTWPAAAGDRPHNLDTAVLVAGIQRANTQIFSLAQRHADKRGMGTTFAGLLVLDDRLVIAHVGDSRVYRMRDRRLDLLTEDHSLLNAFIRAGKRSPDATAPFPYANIITRAVGSEESLHVDTRVDVPRVGDVYLICSDGLHGALGNDREIAAVLLKEHDLTVAVGRLIEAANDHGGPDNVTAVLVRIVTHEAQ